MPTPLYVVYSLPSLLKEFEEAADLAEREALKADLKAKISAFSFHTDMKENFKEAISVLKTLAAEGRTEVLAPHPLSDMRGGLLSQTEHRFLKQLKTGSVTFK